jgi:hypothetical protein
VRNRGLAATPKYFPVDQVIRQGLSGSVRLDPWLGVNEQHGWLVGGLHDLPRPRPHYQRVTLARQGRRAGDTEVDAAPALEMLRKQNDELRGGSALGLCT